MHVTAGACLVFSSPADSGYGPSRAEGQVFQSSIWASEKRHLGPRTPFVDSSEVNNVFDFGLIWAMSGNRSPHYGSILRDLFLLRQFSSCIIQYFCIMICLNGCQKANVCAGNNA